MLSATNGSAHILQGESVKLHDNVCVGGISQKDVDEYWWIYLRSGMFY